MSNLYQRRIERLKAFYPKASRSQLRGHPRKGEKALSSLKPQPIHKIPYRYLTPREKEIRKTSLAILSKVRRGKDSLSKISREEHITPKTVLRHTGAYRKVSHRWVGTKYDVVERVMRINSKGEEISIIIRDSRTATTISRYHHALHKFRETGETKYLKPFKNRTVRDAQGKYHPLETDPGKLYDIWDRQAEEEVFSIYNE